MIRFSNVNKWYGDYQALADINAEVKRGEVVVVCGPSGSGKSTLIRTVNRLEEIQSGELLFDGQSVHARMSGARLNRLRSQVGREGRGRGEQQGRQGQTHFHQNKLQTK